MGIESIAGLATVGKVLGGVGGIISGVSALKGAPKTSNAAATAQANLDAQTEDAKRKKALQAAQRKPTETMLTGGQGLTGMASGAKLG